MAVTVDQANIGTSAGTGQTSNSFNTTQPVAAGAVIVVLASRFNGTNTTLTASVTGPGAMTQAHTVVSGSIRASLFYVFCPAGLASGTNITVTGSGTGNDFTIVAASYLGVDTSGTVVSINAASASTAAWASGSVTATAGNALIGGAGGDGTLSTSTASAGTERVDFNSATSSGSVTLVDKLSSAGGTDSLAGTWTNAITHNGIVAEFKAAAGAAAVAPAPLDPQIQWTNDFGPGDFGPNPFVSDDPPLGAGTVAGVTDLTLTPGTPTVAWTGSTPGVLIDIARTPGTPTVAWSGSTPAIVVDKTLTPAVAVVAWTGTTPAVNRDTVLTPGTPNVAWSGSTPTLTASGDLTLTPGTAVVAWTGSTPAVKVDATRTPGTPDVAWSGSTPAVKVDIARTPAVATVAWSGSTPSVILAGEVTLTPGVATVVWSGSTPALTVTPDVVVPPVEVGGGAAWDGLDDVSTEDPVRSLTLQPGVAVVAWEGSTPTVRVAEPLRFNLPKPFRRAEAPAEPERVVDLTVSPRAGSVAYAGSRPRLVVESFVPVADYDAAQAKIAALERKLEDRDEEALVLAALSAR